MQSSFFKICAVAGLLTGCASISWGTPILGTLNLAGTAMVSLTGLDFIPPVSGGNGMITTLPGGNTGSFATLNAAFTSATILDRDDATQPVGAPLSINNYLTLALMPTTNFKLEGIAPGSYPSASCGTVPVTGQICTPAPVDPDGGGPLGVMLSPYNFANYTDATGSLSSMASFSIRGTIIDGTDATAFEGAFTLTFLNKPYQEVLSTIYSGGSVTAPFSATIEATPIPNDTVPEPAALSTMAIGLAALAAGQLRRRRS